MTAERESMIIARDGRSGPGGLRSVATRPPGPEPATRGQLLADLGVTRSLSRPQVSDDNPFSAAQFKSLKYHPGFPGRFEDITAAIAFCRSFFPWYNTEHPPCRIAMFTPDDVHHHRTLPMCWLSADVPCKPILGPSPRTLRPRRPRNTPRRSRSRLDQPTRHFHNRRNESVNRNRSVSQSRLTGSGGVDKHFGRLQCIEDLRVQDFRPGALS